VIASKSGILSLKALVDVREAKKVFTNRQPSEFEAYILNGMG
jgi:hypothetical protein